MQKVVLATGNPGKVRELAHLLADFGLDVVAQTELGVESAEETGLTFIENAILKARHATAITGLPAIADDSGLAVDILGGAPGIYSARYAGVDASDQENLDKLLVTLKDVPQGGRPPTCRHSRTTLGAEQSGMKGADRPEAEIRPTEWLARKQTFSMGELIDLLPQPIHGGFAQDPVD